MSAAFPGKMGRTQTLRVLAVFYVCRRWDARLRGMVCTSCGALHWGSWYWWILGAGSGIHCGVRPCEVARPPGWLFRSMWSLNFTGLFFKLLHREAGTWSGGMAMAVRRRGASSGPVSGDAVWHSSSARWLVTQNRVEEARSVLQLRARKT